MQGKWEIAWGPPHETRKPGSIDISLVFLLAPTTCVLGLDFLACRLKLEVPFGYWIVLGPSHGDPYEAHAVPVHPEAIGWVEKHGICLRSEMILYLSWFSRA